MVNQPLLGEFICCAGIFYVFMLADGCSSKRLQPWQINEGLLFALAPACGWFLFEWDTGCREYTADRENCRLKQKRLGHKFFAY